MYSGTIIASNSDKDLWQKPNNYKPKNNGFQDLKIA